MAITNAKHQLLQELLVVCMIQQHSSIQTNVLAYQRYDVVLSYVVLLIAVAAMQVNERRYADYGNTYGCLSHWQ